MLFNAPFPRHAIDGRRIHTKRIHIERNSALPKNVYCNASKADITYYIDVLSQQVHTIAHIELDLSNKVVSQRVMDYLMDDSDARRKKRYYEKITAMDVLSGNSICNVNAMYSEVIAPVHDVLAFDVAFVSNMQCTEYKASRRVFHNEYNEQDYQYVVMTQMLIDYYNNECMYAVLGNLLATANFDARDDECTLRKLPDAIDVVKAACSVIEKHIRDVAAIVNKTPLMPNNAPFIQMSVHRENDRFTKIPAKMSKVCFNTEKDVDLGSVAFLNVVTTHDSIASPKAGVKTYIVSNMHDCDQIGIVRNVALKKYKNITGTMHMYCSFNAPRACNILSRTLEHVRDLKCSIDIYVVSRCSVEMFAEFLSDEQPNIAVDDNVYDMTAHKYLKQAIPKSCPCAQGVAENENGCMLDITHNTHCNFYEKANNKKAKYKISNDAVCDYVHKYINTHSNIPINVALPQAMIYLFNYMCTQALQYFDILP